MTFYRGSFIKNPSTMESVLHDCTTIGEFTIKGNIVMNGFVASRMDPPTASSQILAEKKGYDSQ